MHIRIGFAIKGLFCIVSLASCKDDESNERSVIRSVSGDTSKISVITTNDAFEIKYSGDIAFSDDETTILNISPDGYLHYQKGDIILEAQNKGTSGTVSMLLVDGKKIPEGHTDMKYLAAAISEMAAQGVGARTKVERLEQRGGVKAVFSQIKNLRNDRLKAIYFKILLENVLITQNDKIEIAENIATLIEYDNEKKELLISVAPYYLKDTALEHVFFNAVKTISSNNDKADLLRYLLTVKLSPGQVEYWLQAVESLTYNNQQTDVLRAFITSIKPEGKNLASLLDVIAKINGENEKADLLEMLTTKEIDSEDYWVKLIDSFSLISSDKRRVDLLLKVAGKIHQSQKAKASYIRVAKTVMPVSKQEKLIEALQ